MHCLERSEELRLEEIMWRLMICTFDGLTLAGGAAAAERSESAALHDQPVLLADHHHVNLRHEFS